MAITRQKVLVGYRTEKGVIFARYEKQIVEDDGSITCEGIHSETITSEAYDALKKADFVDQVLLTHATEKHNIAVDRDALKAERDSLKAERDSLKVELSAKDVEISVLKKAKK